ncbi:MFS transporter [Micromonospora sp. NPDC050495]|uniref:MFS transporter n=1 Tax=Micromonospora sp. NPDC050495 TaxID=3154936 RepID=UPI0033DB8650
MNSPAPWRALVLLALPALVVAMDQNVLFLALPTLTAELGASVVSQLWVSDIYGLMVAVFLIPFGALADRIGRRRLLLAGSAGFAIFSLIAAFVGVRPGVQS